MGTSVIGSIDEVEKLRGIALKLLTLDRLLANCPGLRGKIVLKQIGLNLDSRPHDFQLCLDEINRLVKQLNDKWGQDTCMFQVVTSIPLERRLAFYAKADVLFHTSVRWGLSADGPEFVAANRDRALEADSFIPGPGIKPPKGPGVIVTSEFVSFSRVLSGALKINPWSIVDTANTLEEALKMSFEERTARHFRDATFADKTTLETWSRNVLSDLATST